MQNTTLADQTASLRSDLAHPWGGLLRRLACNLAIASTCLLVACGGGGSESGGIVISTAPFTGLDSFNNSIGADGNAGLSSSGDSGADGTSGEGKPFANANVTLVDALGKSTTAKTDNMGYYRANITGFTPPIIASARADNGKVYYSLATTAPRANGFITINITGLTDFIASSIAIAAGKAGAADLTGAIVSQNPQEVAKAIAKLRQALSAELTAKGINPDTFDPLTLPFRADGSGKGYDGVLDTTLVTKSSSGATQVTQNGQTLLPSMDTSGIATLVNEFNRLAATQVGRQGAAFADLIDENYRDGIVTKSTLLTRLRADTGAIEISTPAFFACITSVATCKLSGILVSATGSIGAGTLTSAVKFSTSKWRLHGSQATNCGGLACNAVPVSVIQLNSNTVIVPTPTTTTPTVTVTAPPPTTTTSTVTVTAPPPTTTTSTVTVTAPPPTTTTTVTVTTPPPTTTTPTVTVTVPPPTATTPTATATVPPPTATTPTATVTVPPPTATTPTATVTVPPPTATTPTATVTVPPPTATTPTATVTVPPPTTTTPTATVTVPPPTTTTPTVTVTVPPPIVNTAPVSVLSVSVSSLNLLSVNVNGNLSSDADGPIASYIWNFGEPSSGAGNSGAGVTATHTYSLPGSYIVTLTVTDPGGLTATSRQTVVINGATPNASPIANFISTANALLVNFSGATSSDSDGTISRYVWSFGESSSGGANSASGITTTHAYANPGNYTVTLTVTDNGSATHVRVGVISINPSAVATGLLNDTGISANFCYDTNTGSSTGGSFDPFTGLPMGGGVAGMVLCSDPGAIALNSQQDGMRGRDADPTTNSDTDGILGFSYTKIGISGETLANNAVNWSCVKDNVTGLVWEVKTNDGGLRDRSKSYSNFDNTNTFQVNFATGPTAAQLNAATNSIGFKNSVNTMGLCGANDWRLPTARELQSLVNYGNTASLAIDSIWIPNTDNLEFWSSSPFAPSPSDAWLVNFTDGSVSAGAISRVSPLRVRLVRGQ